MATVRDLLLYDVLFSGYCRMFNQQEVQILLGGVNSPVDLEDLRTHTNYGGLYDNKETTIESFWNVCLTFFFYIRAASD